MTNSRSLLRNAPFSTNALPFLFSFTIAGNCGRIDLFCFLDYLSLPFISPVTLRSNDTDLILPLIVESFGAWDVGAVEIMIPIAQCWKRKSRPLSQTFSIHHYDIRKGYYFVAKNLQCHVTNFEVF